MNTNTIKKLLNLNNNFYDEVADEFHKTRNHPWEGWTRLVDIINDEFKGKEIKVLDIGCGNGRFVEVLEKTNIEYNYTGIDNNEKLLEIAQNKYTAKNIDFIMLDVFNELERIQSKYDMIVLFGVTHHIPSRERRVAWFDKIANFVDNKGLFIFTIWNIHKDDRSEKLLDQISEFEPRELEFGDKFYGWSDKNIYRYVHIYSDDELDEIITSLNDENLHLLDKFDHDGKAFNMNSYFVLQRRA